MENWKRPKSEVSTLMALLKIYLRRELQTLLRDWDPGRPAPLRVIRRGAMIEAAVFPVLME